MDRLGNLLETIFSMSSLFQILQSAYLFFSEKLPVLLRIKAKGKARLGVVDLFFFPHNPPSFYPNKSMYELFSIPH